MLEPLTVNVATMAFGKHTFDVQIQRIYRARLIDLKNKPEPRIDNEGNTYTPAVLILDCGAEKIYLYAEDVRRVVPRIDGLFVDIGETGITFTWK